MKQYMIVMIGLLTSPMLWAVSNADVGDQYILMMKPFDFAHPDKISEENFMEMMKHFQGLNHSKIKVGLSTNLSYLHHDIRTLAKTLERILYYAQKTDTPIMIKFDGEQWWQHRSDLWNWWDPEKPGYNPDNRNNVEWRWWGPEYALKICWRNWGRQLRVLPPPNLMSPAYRKACHESMDVLMPILLDWYKALPEDKKYLFVGLNLGWESSIGINAFYYPNGEDLMDKPKSQDPQSGTVRTDVLSRGVVQQGYAAVKTAGIRDSGDITEEDLYNVVHRYLEDLCKYAYDFGFPRDKIISHGWGNENGERMYDAAVNSYSCPGWSEYWYAKDPGQDTGIMRNVQKSDAPYWGVVEWMLMEPHEKEPWKTAITNTLKLPGCKMVCIYWWWFIDKSEPVIEAIREISLESSAVPAVPSKE